jgi:hypothetical protein
VVTLSLAALASALAAVASDTPTTTYRWVDAQGVVHYSDTPQPGAQRLQIQPAQTYRAGASGQPGSAPSGGTADQAYQSCTVVEPQAEQSLYAPESVDVLVELDPARRPGDQISVTLDGHALESPDGSGLHFRIETPDRGAHTLEVNVRDAAGNVVCSSPALTFYVQRPSLLSPKSPARGR